jgi:Xaa-Pro aminopeptidase
MTASPLPQERLPALRRYRLDRVQAELQARDIGGAVLFDPQNIRYATGTRNMAVWTAHNPVRCAFVPAAGLPTLFEFFADRWPTAARAIETVGEVRPAIGWTHLYRGDRKPEAARRWAAEIDGLARAAAPGNRRLAFDRLDPLGAAEIARLGLGIEDGEALLERARLIKSAEEIHCLRHALHVAEAGLARIRAALRPEITEDRLWALLHVANIEMGGEWIETRLLSSGQRTNPWMQECSSKVIRAGELVAIDTDMIGPAGYCADISRTFVCAAVRGSNAQRRLYGAAVAQVEHNVALLRPGASLREVAEREWPIPERYLAYRYGLAHGVGLGDEFPFIYNRADLDEQPNPDQPLQPGMVLSVESYVAEPGGAEGVKLEQQVLVTEAGPEPLSTFPYEDALLA